MRIAERILDILKKRDFGTNKLQLKFALNHYFSPLNPQALGGAISHLKQAGKIAEQAGRFFVTQPGIERRYLSGVEIPEL